MLAPFDVNFSTSEEGPSNDGWRIRVTYPEEQDITELKAEHLRAALSHITDLYQYVNIERNQSLWFGDVGGFFGYEPREFPLTLTGWTELMHPDDRDRIWEIIDRIIERKGKSWTLRYRMRAKDGSYRHVLDRGSVTGYLDGRPNEGCGGIIDETEQVLARKELENALREVQTLKDQLEAESKYLRTEIETDQEFGEIVGDSRAILSVLRQVEMVAPTDATVLLLGETGTGKELLARAIHGRSERRDRPLIKVDCGTLPAGLVESELFGHEKGAFTGAHRSKRGRFELAQRGTIFLDEVSELPLELQAKLLRVLDEGEMQRVGATDDKRVDVRVIAATNRDLRGEVRRGRFRPDLYYRLNVFPIEVPALRERPEDIPRLVSTFVDRVATKLGRQVDGIDKSSMTALVAYDWPGNIRELRNVIERSVILCRGGTLTVAAALSENNETEGSNPVEWGDLQLELEAFERARIMRALEDADWKIKGEGNAASLLGVTPSGVRSRMKRLGITRPA